VVGRGRTALCIGTAFALYFSVDVVLQLLLLLQVLWAGQQGQQARL
jgi:hypothetical protein